MIRLRNITKSYDGGKTNAVDAIDLHVEDGEFLVLLGTSGCGKTTTLKMINRLIEPTSGTIEVDGRDVMKQNAIELRRSIGYVIQGVGLFPHMTVGENIAVVPKLLGWSSSDVAKRVDELLELVNMPANEYRDRLPGKLSGGQQQRVGVARALAARPTIMLMDEPFGALDPLTRDDLQSEFARIHRDLGLTTVMVTHDMTEALILADRIAVMHEGRFVAIAEPRELMRGNGSGDDDDDEAAAYIRKLMETPKRHADRVEELAQGNG